MVCRRLRQSVSQIPASCVADPRIRPYSSLLFYFSYLLSHNWVGIGAGSEPAGPGRARRCAPLTRPRSDSERRTRREPRAGNTVAARVRADKLFGTPFCEVCTRRGKLAPAHHVVPVTAGGPALPELSGLESRCDRCDEHAAPLHPPAGFYQALLDKARKGRPRGLCGPGRSSGAFLRHPQGLSAAAIATTAAPRGRPHSWVVPQKRPGVRRDQEDLRAAGSPAPTSCLREAAAADIVLLTSVSLARRVPTPRRLWFRMFCRPWQVTAARSC
jgi:hypothetical protein